MNTRLFNDHCIIYVYVLRRRSKKFRSSL